MHSIAAVFGVSRYEMISPRRCRSKAAFARQVAMYLTHVVGGFSLSEVGRLFGRDRKTVAHACALVEDRRDDALFDRSLSFLELGILAQAAPCETRHGGVL